MPAIGPETVDTPRDGKGQTVSEAAAHLGHLLEDVLDASGFVDQHVGTEDSVTQTELALTVIAKCVQLPRRGHQSGSEISALNLRDGMRCFKVQSLGPEETGCFGALAALALDIAAPSEDSILISENERVVRPTDDFLGVLACLEQAGNQQRSC